MSWFGWVYDTLSFFGLYYKDAKILLCAAPRRNAPRPPARTDGADAASGSTMRERRRC